MVDCVAFLLHNRCFHLPYAFFIWWMGLTGLCMGYGYNIHTFNTHKGDKMNTFYCSACKQHKPIQHNGGTGYGVKGNGHKVCYACCAIEDQKQMIRGGKWVGYLSKDNDGKWYVTNWPGTLKFGPLNPTSGRHNIAGTRSDVWFFGPDGKPWHGVQYGEWAQICHCKRVKRMPI
jgi:hypothetical protein